MEAAGRTWAAGKSKEAQVREPGLLYDRVMCVRSKIAIPGYGYWVIGRVGCVWIEGLLMKCHLFYVCCKESHVCRIFKMKP